MLTPRQGSQSGQFRPQLSRGRIVSAAVVLSGLLAVGWFLIYRHNTRKLSEDTRVVVRISADALDALAPTAVQEEFSIQEEAAGAEFTGTSRAAGKVDVALESAGDDAVFRIVAAGDTTADIKGIRPPVVFAGKGTGTFLAVKRVRFDGRRFHELNLEVDSTHQTQITSVEPLPGTPLSGAVRLMAMRRARKAAPALDELAAQRIKERVAERFEAVVDNTLQQLQRLNQFDESIQALHPDADDWRIRLRSDHDYLQAALVPAGSNVPELPRPTTHEPTGFEVWLRMTRSERGAIRVIQRWHLAHRLFRRFLPDTEARDVARELRIARYGEWTRLHVGAPTLAELRRRMHESEQQAG
jgi:hypothetical protein